jgi:elongation factor P
MATIKAGAIAKGMFLLMKNEPHLVADREFVNPGKGSAFVRLKMRSLVSGRGLQQVIKTQDTVEEINVEHKDVQYLYADKENYHFMDLQSYEQFTMPLEGQEDKKLFMKEGDTVQLSFWDENPIDILLPYKIVLTVTQAGVGLKGDTVSGATKPVTLETGLVVRVPLFIKEGDKLLINTETREYVERAT